jgi:hypothetical protein
MEKVNVKKARKIIRFIFHFYTMNAGIMNAYRIFSG